MSKKTGESSLKIGVGDTFNETDDERIFMVRKFDTKTAVCRPIKLDDEESDDTDVEYNLTYVKTSGVKLLYAVRREFDEGGVGGGYNVYQVYRMKTNNRCSYFSQSTDDRRQASSVGPPPELPIYTGNSKRLFVHHRGRHPGDK